MASPSSTGVSPCGLFKLPGTPPSLLRRTRSPTVRAGLCFPVSRIHKLFHSLLPPGVLLTRNSSIYLAAVLEYLAAELIEVGGDISFEEGLGRITARHLQHAMRADAEIDFLVRECVGRKRRLMASEVDSDHDADDDPNDVKQPELGGESDSRTCGGNTSSARSPGEEDLLAIQEGCAAMEANFLRGDDIPD